MLPVLFRASVISADALLVKKLKLHRRNYPDVRLFFYNSFDESFDSDACGPGLTGMDVLVFPAYDAPKLLEVEPLPRCRLICYGESSVMPYCIAGGCSDYICEPIDPVEVFQRILKSASETLRLSSEDLLLSRDRLLRSSNGRTAKLSSSDYILLSFFMRNRGRLFSREELSAVLGRAGSFGADSRRVDMQVSRLKSKISKLDTGECISCQKGRGWGIM